MDCSRRSFLALAAAGVSGALSAPASGPRLAWPIEGAPGSPHPVSGAFGPRRLGEYAWRPGIEIVATAGRTVVRAAAAGEATRAAGGAVELRHAGALTTAYGGLAARSVGTGARVARGEPLGLAGPSLDFEVRDGGAPRNPFGLLPHAEGAAHAVQILWANSYNLPHTVDVHVDVRAPREDPDVDRVGVRIRDFATGEVLDTKWVGFQAAHNCGGPSPCASEGISTICLTPLAFGPETPEWRTFVSFKRLRAAETVIVEAFALDLRGHASVSSSVSP